MRTRRSGTAIASLLCYALILMTAISAGAVDNSIDLRSDELYLAAAPVIVEPSAVRAPIGAGAVSTRVTKTEPKNINLDFHAADISDVLKALSVQSGKNIVTSQDVKGQVTVSLSRVSLTDALDTITRLSGYRYAMTNPDTYIVGTATGVDAVMNGVDAGAGDSISEVVVLQYANGADVVKCIQDMIVGVKAGLAANYGAQANAGDSKTDQVWEVTKPGEDPKMRAKPAAVIPRVLLLVGPRHCVTAAKELALKMDTAAKTSGGTVVTKIYVPRFSEATELGQIASAVSPTVTVVLGPTTNFQLKVPETVKSGAGGTGGVYEFKAQPGTIVLTGPEEDVQRAMDALAQVDVKPAQILIEARIMDITDDDAKNLGLKWSWTNIGFSEGSKASGAGNGSFIRLPIDIDAQLDALVTSGKGKLLANPKVAVIAGKPANIFIGDQITYIVSSQLNSLTGARDIQTDSVNVGIQLRAIGIVSPDGDITLNLHPEVSTITGFLETSSSKTPQIASRFADSTIRVKSGSTIAIGGLIRDQDLVTMSKIPLLGDLPFFGGLFKHRSTTKQHSEVTIFLTASVLND